MPLPPEDLDFIASHPAIKWESLRGARLFVTGGTGFWGTWMLESFVHAAQIFGLEAQTTVLSRDPAAFLATHPHLDGCKYLQWHSGDVRDFAFPPGHFSHVLHLATPASAALNNSDPLGMFSTIVDGTRHVLEFCHARNVNRLLLASSGAIHGPQPPDMTNIPEEFAGTISLCDPRAAYAQGKRVAEWMCAAHASSIQSTLEVVTARGWAFVGPLLPLDTHFAVGNFIRDALRGSEIFIAGDGTLWRSYLYASEMTAWLWAILLQGASGRAYNVGSEIGMPLREVAESVANVAQKLDGKKRRVVVAQQANESKPPSRYVPSVARSNGELGLVQSIGLEEAIANTLRWHHGMT